jgi:hypothetical protein
MVCRSEAASASRSSTVPGGPNDFASISVRLRVTGETWIDAVNNFGRWFYRAAGRADRIEEAATQSGCRWFQGIARSRQLFA